MFDAAHELIRTLGRDQFCRIKFSTFQRDNRTVAEQKWKLYVSAPPQLRERV
jgi:hypothetical protein